MRYARTVRIPALTCTERGRRRLGVESGAAPLRYRTIAEKASGGMMGQFLVGAATDPKGPPRGRGRRRARAEHASGSQFVGVGQALSGENVEQVGLGGSDAVRGSLGACAKGTADGHAVIVRARPDTAVTQPGRCD
ncbi:hypothetical protein ACFVT1_13245 [Streptomyces sp. NPDC057963]|uniref:hypothetical protein n=1 Tax=Streptomyces sp. NPDC057963 TaxID=3346290 RepID=UPI0036EACF5B